MVSAHWLSYFAQAFRVSDRVEVVGLTSPEGQSLNGKRGVIIQTHPRVAAAWIVKFDDGTRTGGVKEINLKKAIGEVMMSSP